MWRVSGELACPCTRWKRQEQKWNISLEKYAPHESASKAGVLCFSCDPDWGSKTFLGQGQAEHLAKYE